MRELHVVNASALADAADFPMGSETTSFSVPAMHLFLHASQPTSAVTLRRAPASIPSGGTMAEINITSPA